MAFTKVVGAGIHTQSNIDSHNIHSTGIITATRFDGPFTNLNVTGVVTFAGDVSIGGTLTYEDVTNIDSIGIVTARSGLKVLAGGANIVGVVTATTFKGDGDFVDIDVDGHTELDNVNIAGVVTATTINATLFNGASQVGIQSGGVQIGAGITQLNFIGVGNTFAVNGTTVNVSIAGGAGAGGTWGSNAVGVHTDKIVGINTSTIAGSATSEGALQVTGNIGITEGLLTLDSNLYTSVSVPSGKNALLIGPTTVAVGATIDIATGSTLVVV